MTPLEALIADYINGSKSAKESLAVWLVDNLRNFPNRHLSDPHDITEVVDETVMAFLRQCLTETIDDPVSYVFMMCRNQSISKLRKTIRSHPKTIPLVADPVQIIPEMTVEEKEEVKSLIHDLIAELEKLGDKGDRYARIIRAHYFGGQSLREVARQLDISFDYCRQLAIEARKSLVNILASHGYTAINQIL